MNSPSKPANRYVFITGGVLSSLGKGTIASCLGALLRMCGFSIRMCKIDPYINVDPGTMNPFEHGEVFVTTDGGETDLDFGHYERFTSILTSRHDSTTTGKIFSNIINRERRGGYNGQTVQIVPHFVNEVHAFLDHNSQNVDVTICEVGGTVGDIESQSFIEAIRQVRLNHGVHNTMYIHVVPIYHLPATQELKSKPAQHSVRNLLGYGIQPDILCCRTPLPLPDTLKTKLATACNLSQEKIIASQDIKIIYQLPLALEKEGLLTKTLAHFNLPQVAPKTEPWTQLINHIQQVQSQTDAVDIAIIGKYVAFKDTYCSLSDALWHASIHTGIKINLHWMSVDNLHEHQERLCQMDGILIPGGFGARGLSEKIAATSVACTHDIPFLGICLGLQSLALYYARQSSQLSNPFSEEFQPNSTGTTIIAMLSQWTDIEGKTQKRTVSHGKLRLGDLPITIAKDSLAHRIYQSTDIQERHRHRYHTVDAITPQLAEAGLMVSARSKNDNIVEIMEVPSLSFCIGVQYHPEFASTPFKPHPVFQGFLRAASKKKAL